MLDFANKKKTTTARTPYHHHMDKANFPAKDAAKDAAKCGWMGVGTAVLLLFSGFLWHLYSRPFPPVLPLSPSSGHATIIQILFVNVRFVLQTRRTKQLVTPPSPDGQDQLVRCSPSKRHDRTGVGPSPCVVPPSFMDGGPTKTI